MIMLLDEPLSGSEPTTSDRIAVRSRTARSGTARSGNVRGRHRVAKAGALTAPAGRPVDLEPAPPLVLRGTTSGRACPVGHFNDAAVRYCTACGRAMAHADPTPVHGRSPSLGLLVIDDGTVHPLHQDVVIGAAAEVHPDVAAGRADPLRLDGPDVAPVHTRVVLRGDDIQVIDGGSDVGTAIAGPTHGGYSRLRPDTPTVIAPGTRVLVGQRSFVYQTHHAPSVASTTVRRPRAVRRWRSHAPARLPLLPLFIGMIAAVAGLLLLVAVGVQLDATVFITPLAASMALIVAAPNLPFSQPRNVVGGQLISATIGVVAFTIVGGDVRVAAIAAGLAVGVMLLTRTFHAPAAATAALAVVEGPEPVRFLLLLALATFLLVIIGMIGTRLGRHRKYPAYWW